MQRNLKKLSKKASSIFSVRSKKSQIIPEEMPSSSRAPQLSSAPSSEWAQDFVRNGKITYNKITDISFYHRQDKGSGDFVPQWEHTISREYSELGELFDLCVLILFRN